MLTPMDICGLLGSLPGASDVGQEIRLADPDGAAAWAMDRNVAALDPATDGLGREVKHLGHVFDGEEPRNSGWRAAHFGTSKDRELM